MNGDDGASAIGLPASAAAVEADDGTYLFKFVTPSGRTHRFQARYDSYETIREIVCIKLGGDPFFDPTPSSAPTVAAYNVDGESNADAQPAPAANAGEGPDPNDFQLAYTDDEDDVVLITADGDVQDSVKVARKQGRDRVVLLLQGGRGWEARASASAATSAGGLAAKKRQQARENAEAQLQSVAEEEEKRPTTSRRRRGGQGEEVSEEVIEESRR